VESMEEIRAELAALEKGKSSRYSLVVLSKG
jgi:hypothetical protein